MAIVGGTVTDDALYGIPAPDYSDTEDDSTPSNKQKITATLSSDNSAKHKPTDTVEAAEKSQRLKDDKPAHNQTDEELEIPKPDYSSDEDDVTNKPHEVTSKHNDTPSGSRSGSDSLSPVAANDSKLLLSPDGSIDGLSLNSEEKKRGSFRSSGSRSPISPPMGVSHEHAAVDPVLIEAKKVPMVPQLTKEQKELQRELQFKQKQGNMLEKKPELQKAMDDRKFKMKKEELKKEQENKQSTFNVKLGKQALKLMQLEEQNEKQKLAKTNSTPEDQQLDEFKKIHSKIHKNNKITT